MAAIGPVPSTVVALRPQSRARGRGRTSLAILTVIALACIGSLPYTAGRVAARGTVDDSTTGAPREDAGSSLVRRYERNDLERALLPPSWASHREDEAERRDVATAGDGDDPLHVLGTDRLGRDLLTRCLAGGAISLAIGFAAAAISVLIGTLYGTIAGSVGGRPDAIMMRIVDVLYGLPYVLLVVLLAVAAEGVTDRMGDAISPGARQLVNIATLLVAIGGVSWLTMARVVRGQVLSLREQPFMEACRAVGVPWMRQFTRHLLPNLMGPIIVYATLTVPQAILQESFLSFLGIGVKAPLPSWGNLAAEGLSELNPVRARWWLLLWPCLLLAVTLLSLNFMGEALRQRFDPRGRSRANRD